MYNICVCWAEKFKTDKHKNQGNLFFHSYFSFSFIYYFLLWYSYKTHTVIKQFYQADFRRNLKWIKVVTSTPSLTPSFTDFISQKPWLPTNMAVENARSQHFPVLPCPSHWISNFLPLCLIVSPATLNLGLLFIVCIVRYAVIANVLCVSLPTN